MQAGLLYALFKTTWKQKPDLWNQDQFHERCDM